MFQVGDKVRIKSSNHLILSISTYQQHCGEETKITEINLTDEKNNHGGLYRVASNSRLWYGVELEQIEDTILMTENELLNIFID